MTRHCAIKIDGVASVFDKSNFGWPVSLASTVVTDNPDFQNPGLHSKRHIPGGSYLTFHEDVSYMQIGFTSSLNQTPV